jgi:hypothetical protein
MLGQSLAEEELRVQQTAALTSIRRRRFTPTDKSASSLDLLREDRQR